MNRFFRYRHVLRNTEQGDASTGAGTAPAAPAAAPAAQAAPAIDSSPQPPNGAGGADQGSQHAWFNDRIAQAKRSAQAELLKELGITDPAAAREMLQAGQRAIDAGKTELQRKDDEVNALRAVATQAQTYQEAIAKRAAAELQRLPEAARERVKAIAGDDPLKLLETIDLALTMGTSSSAPAAAAAPATAPAAAVAGTEQARAPVPPAASTSAAAGGPPSATGSPPDHLVVWRDMQSRNPLAAAHYYLAHQREIVTLQQTKTET